MCLSLSAAKQHDGWVSAEYVRMIVPGTKRDRDGTRVVTRCVQAGLLEEFPKGTEREVAVRQPENRRDVEVTVGPHPVDGFYIHDFLEVNLSKGELEAVREKRRKAGSEGGKRSASAKQVLSKRSSNAQATDTETDTETEANNDNRLAEVVEILKGGKFDPMGEGDDMAILASMRARRRVDPVSAAHVAVEWSHGKTWRTRSRAETFRHAMRDLERTQTKETGSHHPTAAGMVAKRDSCLDCGREITTGTRCRACARILEDRLTRGGPDLSVVPDGKDDAA